MTNCPTTRVLDASKAHSELYRVILTRYRLATRSGYIDYKETPRANWPFKELFDKDIKEMIERIKDGSVVRQVKNDVVGVTTLI